MNINDLRKLLESSSDRLSVLSDMNTIMQCENLTIKDFKDIVSEFLSDEEKFQFLKAPEMKKLNSTTKASIISLILDENVCSQIVNDEELLSNLSNNQIKDIAERINDDLKKQLLYNSEFLKKYEYGDYDVKLLISSCDENTIQEILKDKILVTEKLKFETFQIATLLQEIDSDEVKLNLVEYYGIEGSYAVDVINSCSTDTKLKIILEDEKFSTGDKNRVILSLEPKSFCEFIINNKDFLEKINTHPYELTNRLSSEAQKYVVQHIEELGVDIDEKRRILAILKDEVKKDIDVKDLPEEYKTALSMEREPYSPFIKFDPDRNLEEYRGLDDLINIRPEELTVEQKKRLLELCDICPNAKVFNRLEKDSIIGFLSTAKEYKEAEKWIDSVIDSLDPEWTDLEKLAAIDNAVGKKISYAPDFDTEVSDGDAVRALWKIISTGYGVCNGISRVEKEILDRVGIESEVVSSGTHAFLKIKDIEIPSENGEMIRGNTIVDPTWNLTENRYGAKPSNFCVSYEEIRKNDIDDEGKDHACHLNDEKLQDATLNLDEENLRRTYYSIGMTNRDGEFPIVSLINISDNIDEIFANNPKGNVYAQLQFLEKYYPDFAECQNSTIAVLSQILLNHQNLNFNQCVVNRVYNRDDEEKKPTFYAYIDYPNEIGKKFFVANKVEGRFDEYSLEEFEKQFECYEMDLKRGNGVRPWQKESRENENIDLSRSSGKVVAAEEKSISSNENSEQLDEEGR